jgi:hypothetical protein
MSISISLVLTLKPFWPHTGLHFYDRLLALPTNIRLGWKRIGVANALAYYVTAAILSIQILYTLLSS